jgi:DNA-binding MarR family transcriptional regulator
VDRDAVDAIAEAWERELPGVIGVGLALGKRTTRVSTMLAARAEAELGRFGLTRAEYEILAVLRAAGPPYQLRPADISQRLMLSSGGTSNLLRRLVDAELVERDPHPSDARSSWVRLSPSGVKVAEEAVRAVSEGQAALLRTVPPETLRAAVDSLRALLIALRDLG